MNYREYEELPCILIPSDIMEILHISKNSAYELCKSKGFPTMRVGRKIRIPKDKFLIWIEDTLKDKYISER